MFSSFSRGRWTDADLSNTFCSVKAGELSITQIAGLLMLPYYEGKKSRRYDQILEVIFKSKYDDVQIKTADEMCPECKKHLAISSDWMQGINVEYHGTSYFVTRGLLQARDWAVLIEQLVLTYISSIIKGIVPYYSLVSGIYRKPLIVATQLTSDVTGSNLIGTQVVNYLEDLLQVNVNVNATKKKKFIIGHLNGGYFAKYIGMTYRDKYTGISFDSFSFFGTPHEKVDSKCPVPENSLNIYSRGSIVGSAELYMKYNFERETYNSIIPADGFEAFCLTVAQCSTRIIELDFCEQTLGKVDFAKMMKRYNRDFVNDTK